MRIDKYLKVTRLIKRRSVANEACDQGRITVNGRVVKASYDVKENDIIEIKMGERIIKVQVMAILHMVQEEKAVQAFQHLIAGQDPDWIWKWCDRNTQYRKCKLLWFSKSIWYKR